MENIQKIYNGRLDCEMQTVTHSSGLKIIVMPMQNYSSSYVIFGTKYGSMNSRFKLAGEKDFSEVPQGIAHFLEHKLFENEQCGAFERYAKTGASANAFTSFDKTCYLFSCSDNFEPSLEILLDFVTSPYFTPETVQKEQGIIGQEIKMYDDNPEWQVYFGIIKALYNKIAIRDDIAGTVESIAKITPELLYRCYNAFYSLDNMVLCACGKVDINTVLSVADRVLKPREGVNTKFELPPLNEPETVSCQRLVKNYPVPIPVFAVGYKLPFVNDMAFQSVASDIFCTMLTGEHTELFNSLLNSELIDEDFGSECLQGPGYRSLIFMGNSNNPEAVKATLDEEIERIKAEGVNNERFERARKKVYGELISNLETADLTAYTATDMYFGETDIFTVLETAASITALQLEQWLELVNTKASAISIVKKED